MKRINLPGLSLWEDQKYNCLYIIFGDQKNLFILSIVRCDDVEPLAHAVVQSICKTKLINKFGDPTRANENAMSEGASEI